MNSIILHAFILHPLPMKVSQVDTFILSIYLSNHIQSRCMVVVRSVHRCCELYTHVCLFVVFRCVGGVEVGVDELGVEDLSWAWRI